MTSTSSADSATLRPKSPEDHDRAPPHPLPPARPARILPPPPRPPRPRHPRGRDAALRRSGRRRRCPRRGEGRRLLPAHRALGRHRPDRGLHGRTVGLARPHRGHRLLHRQPRARRGDVGLRTAQRRPRRPAFRRPRGPSPASELPQGRATQHRRALRPLQRLLPALPRPLDDVLLRPLGGDDVARAGAGEQERGPLPPPAPACGGPRHRDRHRLGRLGPARRAQPWLPRHDAHHLPSAA